MKKVLCFGDSNTYGYIPASGKRYDKHTRWTGILQELLGNDFKLIEAGCNNRTCFNDNPKGIFMTGYKILPEFLEEDLDYVILAVGINDLQFFYNVSRSDVKKGIENLVDKVRKKLPPAKIILLSPPVITDDILSGYFSSMFDKNSILKSHWIGSIYETVSKNKGCFFVNLNDIAKVSKLDGLHFDPEEHAKIAHEIYFLIKQIEEAEKNKVNNSFASSI